MINIIFFHLNFNRNIIIYINENSLLFISHKYTRILNKNLYEQYINKYKNFYADMIKLKL
jgi:hypothetical protein